MSNCLELQVNDLSKKLEKIKNICNINKGIDWISSTPDLSAEEEFQAIIDIIDAKENKIKIKGIIDRGDMCLHCRQDTKFGTGKFVNRYPAEIHNEEKGYDEKGYCCDDCEQAYYKNNKEEKWVL
tara:strand:+ start:40 stop:414 length:375 start_codon:yes stop_codon:yes gene_type:complete